MRPSNIHIHVQRTRFRDSARLQKNSTVTDEKWKKKKKCAWQFCQSSHLTKFIKWKNTTSYGYLSALDLISQDFLCFRVWLMSHQFMGCSVPQLISGNSVIHGMLWGSYKSVVLSFFFLSLLFRFTDVNWHSRYWSPSQKWGSNQMPDLWDLSVPISNRLD